MKQKVRHILAIVFFASCMTACGYFAYYLLTGLFWASLYEQPYAVFYFSPVLVAGVAAVVFLVLYLSFKRPRKMF